MADNILPAPFSLDVNQVIETEQDYDVEVVDVTRTLLHMRLEGVDHAFRPFVSPWPTHAAAAQLPFAARGRHCTPLVVFRLLLSPSDIETIVLHSNQYAILHGAQDWCPLDADELRTWIGIVIYMGVYQMARPMDGWSTDDRQPKYPFASYMSRNRFKHIERYLHISPPHTQVGSWYAKIEPLVTNMKTAFRKYYVPPSNVSVDEMMVRFSGRSAHTVRMKNKPIAEGYKIISLSAKGYCYGFELVSQIEDPQVPIVPGLNATASVVVHLCSQLPHNRRQFHVYMYNYYSCIPLFEYLLDMGIAVVNSFMLYKAAEGAALSHKDFRLQLAWELITSTKRTTKSKKRKARIMCDFP
ncbi:hypothetical protein ATCC90586_000104 [Pythium insidiosum]|nr:hypothetical protein ATCC90586_000104 [Pythium insidiosum]